MTESPLESLVIDGTTRIVLLVLDGVGDLPDPVSGQRSEPNLEGAAQMIEILSLLDEKTRGNLTAEERQVLEQVLYELRLRYVDASAGGKRIIEP